MSLKQQEKSELTHQTIKTSALQLFLEKGYKNTSVQDIVTASGYSIGSFYKHYKTKRDVLVEIWNEHAIDSIRISIEELEHIETPEELANYLVDNSNVFSNNEKTKLLAEAARDDLIFGGKDYESVRAISGQYIKQIANILKRFCPNTEDSLLISHASILDAIQYSHSEVNSKKIGYQFDDEDVKHNLKHLIICWIKEDHELKF